MNDNVPQLSDLELEFMQELRGNGSLSPNIVNKPENSAVSDGSYVGYDIRPEDLEALFFEGLGVLRWEQVTGGKDLDEHVALYWENFNARTAPYPLISRVKDTDLEVAFTADEAPELHKECAVVLSTATDSKAVRALQKLSIAAKRAADGEMALILVPNGVA